MALYLVLKRIDSASHGVIERGEKSDLGWLSGDQREALINRQVIRELKSPPLSVFKGWKTRADKLAPHGYRTVADFVGGDYAQIARLMRVKLETVEKWAGQLKAWAGTGEDVNMVLSKK